MEPTPQPDIDRLALALVKAIVAEKEARGIIPTYAVNTEINARLHRAFDSLTAEGLLIRHCAGVNRKEAYTIPVKP